MTTFGLDTPLVLRLARAVAPPPHPPANAGAAAGSGDAAADDSPAAATDRFARASWTGIAEPGDGLAGLVVGALGPTLALTVLVESWPLDRVSGALADAGADGVSTKELSLALDRWRPRLVSNAAITSLRQAERTATRILTPADASWPAGVEDLGAHAPIALWARGLQEAVVSLETSIALVGARAATGYGEHLALELGAGLSDRGITVVSGAAYGIDGMAHRAALASGGLTVAFLAGGADRFYPGGHEALLGRIATVGAVISELPCGAAPTKWRFLQRNRLIAAASAATVVIEAGSRSGSLNTAAHAAALGRPLGAVPGPVTSPASAGCHRLIREFDAVCVTTVEDVLELVAGTLRAGETGIEQSSRSAPEDRRPAEQTRVLDALSIRSARSPTEVARRSGLAVDVTQSVLGLLQIEAS